MEYSRSALSLEYDDYKGEGYGDDTGPSEAFTIWAYNELVAWHQSGGDVVSWYTDARQEYPDSHTELFNAYTLFIEDFYDGDIRNLQNTKSTKRKQPNRNLSRPQKATANGNSGSSIWPDDTAAFIAVGVALLGIAILAARELR
jgi:hypothetical protein